MIPGLVRMLMVLMSVGVAGCSSKLLVTEIPVDLAPGSAVNGIPFRVAKRYEAQLYEKTAAGYVKLDSKFVTLPDQSHLYLLGFQGQPFANGTVELALNSDNTIQQVSLVSVSHGADALKEASTQLTAVTLAVATKRTGEETGATTKVNLIIAAEAAKQAADLAELQNRTLQSNPNATAEEILKAAQNERLLKLKANEAARLAGIPPYFPSVVAGAGS